MIKDEPVVAVGAAVIVVLNALIAVVAYFASLEPEAATLLGALASALVGLGVAVARSRVTPMSKLRRVAPAAAELVE